MSSFNQELFCLKKRVINTVDAVTCAVADIVDNVIDDNVIDDDISISQTIENRDYIRLRLEELLDDVVNFVNDNQDMVKETPTEQLNVEQTIKTDSTGMPIISW